MEQEAHDTNRDSEARKADDATQPDRPTTKPESVQKQEAKQTSESEQKDVKAKRPLSTRADIAQVIIQSVLVTGAIYGLYIYEGQLKAARLSNDLMRGSVLVAMDADTARLDQRAWVATVDIEGVPEAGKAFVAKVKIKNTGKTFATHFAVLANYCGREKDAADPDFDVALKTDVQPESRGVLSPNPEVETEIRILGDAILTESKVDRINSGEYVIIVFGRIVYKDIFESNHWTTFCYRYQKGPLWYNYSHYNQADKKQW